MRLKPIVFACMLALAAASASAAEDPAMTQMKQQIEALQKQLAAMQGKLEQMSAAPAPQAQASPTQQQAQSQQASAAGPLTTTIGGAAVTLYGYADLSVDSARNGVERVNQVSSNLSYLGVKAAKPLGSTGVSAIAQVETLVNISGTPTETGGLGSRNSFVGLQGNFGKIMLGKYDTPYKRSTAAMDPFASSVADYNSIMGNTGGDLRAEFDARLSHSIFWDSPVINGFSANVLVSPGQKLMDLSGGANNAFPQGEKVCSGATPGSSGSLPDATTNSCNDGAFGNAYSAAVNYENGPLFATAAYERHQSVNRSGDTGGVVANESAAKVGVSYKIAANRVSAIYEKFFRGGGIDPTLNERARNGYYLSDVYTFAPKWDAMLAWAHAGQTPGGPDFGTLDDQANMYAVGLKYHMDVQTSFYAVATMLKQGAGAHYALGASGHGTPIASPRSDAGDTLGGHTLTAVSAGMQYAF